MPISRPMRLRDGAIAPLPPAAGRTPRAAGRSGTRRLQRPHPDHVEGRSGLEIGEQRRIAALVERYRRLAPAALASGATPCVVDEDAAHGVGRDGEELLASARGDLTLPQQPQMGHVDEPGRRERVTVRLTSQLLTRDAPQFVADQWEKRLERAWIAGSPA